MNKAKHFETESGNFVKTAEFNGYNINDRTFEDLMFQVDITDDGTLKVYVKPEDQDYFSDFNESKWLKVATEYAYRCDSYRDPVSGEDCWLEFETPVAVAAKPIATNTSNPFDKIKDILGEDSETEIEVKEPKIGKFKTKRKYLNFVALANGTKVRFITDTAIIDGKQLSGILEKSEFKFTICDEGIDIEEISDNKLADDAMLQRIAYELDDITPNGYAGKFILPLKFKNDKNILFYLETEYQKPIDRLRSIFDELDQESTQEKQEENMEISEKGLAALDLIFGAESAITEDNSTETEVLTEPVKEETYLEKQFRLMNEGKVNELKERIEKTESEINKYKFEAKNAEKMLNKSVEDLEVLKTRLNSMTPADPENGYAFFVSDEQKSDIQLDDKTIEVATKISEMLKLKTNVVLENLTESYYIINVADKNDFDNKKITKEVYQSIVSIDIVGKFNFIEDGKIEYRGKLNWHQLTDKLIRKGFSQEPDFDIIAGSNSYESKTEVISNDGGFVLIAEKTDNLTVFIGNKGGWLKNSDANKNIFDKLSFVGEMYQPKKGEKGEKICSTTTGSGKTYVRVRFPEGECVINQDKLR